MSLTTASRVNELILSQLATREMRLLAIIVGTRKGLGTSQVVKGDLAAIVSANLRRLVSARLVRETEGLYSLAPVPPQPKLAKPVAAPN